MKKWYFCFTSLFYYNISLNKFNQTYTFISKEKLTRNLEFAAQVFVDAARLHIGDTSLLDYVLRSLNNVIVGNYVVRRMVNPSSRILEYTIHELGRDFKAPEVEHRVITVADNPQGQRISGL